MFGTLIPSRIFAAATLATCLSASVFGAAAGTWGVRVRATRLDMANKSDAFGAVAANAVSVENKVIPEFDISYWFTPKFAAELVLTYPQEHEVKLAGTSLGTFKHLPPTLLAQYHFLPEGDFQPYIGAGVNLTLISDVKLYAGPTRLDLEHSSVGLAAQAGFDYKLKDGVYLNVDAKKVGIRSDVMAAGARLTTAKLDPWLFSVGIGWRF